MLENTSGQPSRGSPSAMHSPPPAKVLGRLPLELVINVLRQLDAPQLVRCCAVSKDIKKIIDTSLALQYTIKLALAGYEDGRRVGTGRLSTTAVRIERLQEHIDAWNHLNWTPESRVIVPFASALQLAGGVFATFSGETITFVELPSAHSWHSYTQVVVREIESRVANVDGVQAMLFTPTLHVRNLSDNMPHAGAVEPVIHSLDDYSHDVEVSSIQIMGSLLGIVYYDPVCAYSHLEIWEWVTGRLVTELRSLSKDLYSHGACFSSFSFLNPFFFMVPRDAGVIDIYEFSVNGVDVPPSHVASFHLPPIRFGASGSLVVIAEPLPYDEIQPSDDPGKLFDVTGDDRMVRIHWSTWRDVHVRQNDPSNLNDLFAPYSASMERCFDIFVPLRIFREYHKFIPSTCTSTTDQPFDIPWQEWGPKNTRFTNSPTYTRNCFPRHVHGNRSVAVVHSGGTPHLVVRDYSRGRPEWMRRFPKEIAADSRVQLGIDARPLETEGGIHLESNVWSSLPYSCSSRPLGVTLDGPFTYSVLCDDERVLFIKEIEDRPDVELIILTM
ncbi:hypothetical protein BS47DRAFT_1379337 [Hydnum rufescens UP504]|uniref:F-box domain-containing protein n=1 Tax=Hydnum rufescens UP504 TaxID=1448309 RepID=A0A9P6B872_9AGAM|nr:hypothetical protein BS47DRAFT_1379337 [Hydnum rufescens UP504]